jgi:hypothetical protein
MKLLIKKLLRENLLSEEFNGGVLYGYHVTDISNLENIKKDGLKIGSREMQGKGLYAFYDYDHAVRYAMKGEIPNVTIIRFSVLNKKRFLYLNMEIAKTVLGSEYHLMDQIENYWYGGFKEFFGYVKQVRPSVSEEKVKEIINNIETDNTEMNQRTLVFSLLPKNVNDSLNIVWDGNYGLEYRINRLDHIDIDGYFVYDNDNEKFVFSPIDFTENIPNTEEFKPLFDFIRSNNRIDSITKALTIADNAMLNSRNNRDWDYYKNILYLINKLKSNNKKYK